MTLFNFKDKSLEISKIPAGGFTFTKGCFLTSKAISLAERTSVVKTKLAISPLKLFVELGELKRIFVMLF